MFHNWQLPEPSGNSTATPSTSDSQSSVPGEYSSSFYIDRTINRTEVNGKHYTDIVLHHVANFVFSVSSTFFPRTWIHSTTLDLPRWLSAASRQQCKRRQGQQAYTQWQSDLFSSQNYGCRHDREKGSERSSKLRTRIHLCSIFRTIMIIAGTSRSRCALMISLAR